MAGQPRKSALKSGQQKSSSFHASHLPPPEFADLPSPPPSIAVNPDSVSVHLRSASNELIHHSDHVPLIAGQQGGRGPGGGHHPSLPMPSSSSSSFRTLPTRQSFHQHTTSGGLSYASASTGPPSSGGGGDASIMIQHTGSASHQTLPLKSNLKKPGSTGTTPGGSGSNHKLHWNNGAPQDTDHDNPTNQNSANSRSSMEELRV